MINRIPLVFACLLTLASNPAPAQNTVFPEDVEAIERVEAAERRARAAGLVEQVIGQFRLAPAPARPVQIQVQEGLIEAPEIVVFDGPFEVPAPVQPVGNGELNAAEQQILTRTLEPMLVHEMAFARKACGLDEREFKLVSDAAQAELKSIAKQYVKAQRQPRRIVRINGVQRVQPAQPNPRKLIEKSIASAIEAKLPEQQAALFAQEIAKRDDYRKQAGVENLVGFLDERLMLDAAQREQIAESLLKNWDENWISQLEALLNVQEYIPPLPNQLILPHLRQSQKDVWQTASQNNRGMMIQGGLHHWNFIAPQQILINR